MFHDTRYKSITYYNTVEPLEKIAFTQFYLPVFQMFQE